MTAPSRMPASWWKGTSKVKAASAGDQGRLDLYLENTRAHDEPSELVRLQRKACAQAKWNDHWCQKTLLQQSGRTAQTKRTRSRTKRKQAASGTETTQETSTAEAKQAIQSRTETKQTSGPETKERTGISHFTQSNFNKDKRMAVVWWDDETGWNDTVRLDFLAQDARQRNNGHGTTSDKVNITFYFSFLHFVFCLFLQFMFSSLHIFLFIAM